MKKLFLFILFLFTLFLFVEKPAFAQLNPKDNIVTPGINPKEGFGEYEDISGKIHNPVLPDKLSQTQGVFFLSNFLKNGITLVFVIGAVLFFFILVTGGIKWISSSGDKARLESAQKQVTSGLVGMVILLSSFAIIKLVGSLFGVDLLNITLPTL